MKDFKSSNTLFTDKFWKGRRVLVTGAFGFIGSWLVHFLLQQDAIVFAFVLPERKQSFSLESISSKNLSIINGNIDDYESIKSAISNSNIDSIFHLAAINSNFQTDTSPKLIFDTNILGTYNVLESARFNRTVKRIVIASSREAEDIPRTGDNSINGRPLRLPYQVSKISAELIAQAYHDTYGLPVTVARFSNVYGGGDLNWIRLIPNTIKQVLSGSAPELRSNGKMERDFIFVEDIVRAYLLLGDKAGEEGISGEIFYFGTGKFTSVSDVVKKITSLAGKTNLKPIIMNKSKNERIDESYLFEKEQKILGWTSKIDITVGLNRTFEWYKSYFGN